MIGWFVFSIGVLSVLALGIWDEKHGISYYKNEIGKLIESRKEDAK